MPANTSPQSVSSRYAHNLLCRGSNRTFELNVVKSERAWSPSGVPCGTYFIVQLHRRVDLLVTQAEGTTPVDAVKAALITVGVTFR